jgi:hypothetical protein
VLTARPIERIVVSPAPMMDDFLPPRCDLGTVGADARVFVCTCIKCFKSVDARCELCSGDAYRKQVDCGGRAQEWIWGQGAGVNMGAARRCEYGGGAQVWVWVSGRRTGADMGAARRCEYGAARRCGCGCEGGAQMWVCCRAES